MASAGRPRVSIWIRQQGQVELEGHHINVSNSALGLLYGHGILTIYENLLL